MTYSYLICGQINSRIGSNTLEQYFSNLRSQLPDAEIVVSTWYGEFDINFGYLIDGLVLSEDPGISEFGGNWKRILVATQAGLSACDSEFVVRSRIEVEFEGDGIFNREVQKSIPLLKSGVMIYPLGVSNYMINKGLMFGLPDFMQIASKEHMREYWSADSALRANQDFAMTSDWDRSLSSDQAILAIYLSKFLTLKPCRDRYKFYRKNWRVFSNYLENSCNFFDEDIWGTNFGRLKRRSDPKIFKLSEIGPGQMKVEMHLFAIFHFYYLMKRSQLRRYAISKYLSLKELF